jgi:aryl-alcohol dehydrogenase-like predicted oxidoreductase
MDYRPLGRTGLEVSVVGYGAWGIGKSMWIGADDEESLRALDRAIDPGSTSSTPRSATATAIRSSSWARPSASGARPSTWRRRPVQQFHVWHDNRLEQGDWLDTIEALEQEGKIGAFGVSINDHEPSTPCR